MELECPLFRQKKFRRNFFDGIHDTEYGIPYVAEFRIYGIPHYGIPLHTEFRIFTEFRMLRNSVFLRNSAEYEIPHCGIPQNTKFRIAEFIIHGIPHFYGIP